MPKDNTKKNASTYKFSTSDYIVMNMNVKREASTGRLVETSPSKAVVSEAELENA